MKTKKLLSILLAVMMMLSVVPIYASAATITLNTTNVIILEAPKISYGDQIDVNVITANYGVTANDLTVTGGKLGYIASEGAEPVVIPGTFSGSSTLKFSVGENSAIRLKFTPDDTATYSSPQISTSYTMAEGVVWPSANVIGQAVTVAEYPTIAATTIGLGSVLSTAAKISGGKVVDADGNEVSGAWSYVNNRIMDTAGTFEEEYQWKKTGYATIVLKVTITVKEIESKLEQAPTAAGIKYTQKLSAATLSGGKVVDENGTDITAVGKWAYVNPNEIPKESGEYDVQWTATGCTSVTAKAYVAVQTDEATLVEIPEQKFVRTSAFLFDADDNIQFTDGTGKVVDKDGNDITSQGEWKCVPDGKTIIMKNTEIDIVWEGLGYAPVYAKMVCTVGDQYPSNLTVAQFPAFESSYVTDTYVPDKTVADYIKLNPGEIVDEQGNKVEGTWSFYVNGSSDTPDQILAGVMKFLCYAMFTPADSSLPVIKSELNVKATLEINKANFSLVEGSELVLNYGTAYKTSFTAKENDFRFSNLVTNPESVGVSSISWDKSDFDPATADYGTVAKVTAKIKPNMGAYNELTTELNIRIQKYIHDNTNKWYFQDSSLSFTGTPTETYDGIRNYKIDFKNTRLKGTVDLIVNEEVVVSVSPDENGKFYAEGQWLAPASGEYSYRFEYKPSEADTATVTNPIAREGTAKMDIRPYHTLTIIVGEQTFTYTERLGSIIYFDWDKKTGLTSEDFSSWVFTDADGNAYNPVVVEEGTDPTKTADLYIRIDNCDFTATMKDSSIFGDIGDIDIGIDSIWSFFQKIIDWFMNIIKQMMSLIGLGA